jgi:cytochrome P450
MKAFRRVFRRNKNMQQRTTATDKDDALLEEQETKNAAISSSTDATSATAAAFVVWPTAQARVHAANMAEENGHSVMPTRDNTTQMIVCPIVGKELLRRYEDCKRHDDDDDDDNSERSEDTDDNEHEEDVNYGNDNCKQTKTKSSNKMVLRLHKPIKPNRLLGYALTNANGDDWRRQRPLVQRALGDAMVSKTVAVPAAVQAALQFLSQKEGAAESATKSKIEVRSFSLEVATATMMAAVFGMDNTNSNSDNSNNDVMDESTQKQIAHAIKDLFLPSLLPIRGDAPRAQALDAPVRLVMDQLAKKGQSSKSNPCLAVNLLQHEEDEGEGEHQQQPQNEDATKDRKSLLSRNEVVANCHSALLAGTQTIATTLVGAVLHLAEYEEESEEHENDHGSHSFQGKNRAWFRAVVNETLRILPPVASLPRCPVHDTLKLPLSAKNNKNMNGETKSKDGRVAHIPPGQVLVLDVLSMAHSSSSNSSSAPTTPPSSHDPTTTTSNTWKFCLDDHHKSSTKCSRPTAYPWGFGDRQCPAGNLSVASIAAVLEAIMSSTRSTKYHWTLANPEQDSVGLSGREGWMAKISYQPTLTYQDPLFINMVSSATSSPSPEAQHQST